MGWVVVRWLEWVHNLLGKRLWMSITGKVGWDAGPEQKAEGQ